jgi:signal transduction histidine kinase
MMPTPTMNASRPAGSGKRFSGAIALLLSVAGALVAVLAWQTWQTARAHRGATEGVFRDHASFAAWSFGSRVRAATFYAINPIFAGADGAAPQPGAVLAGVRGAADSIATCRCGVDLAPDYVFLIDLADGSNRFSRRETGLTDGEISGRLEVIRATARASFARGSESREPGALPYRWAAGSTGGSAWIAFYAARFRSREDAGVIVGFQAPAETFASRILAPAFATASLLPPSLVRGTPADSILQVEVRTRGGEPFYRSASSFASSYLASESLGAPDTALVATVAINPRAASALIIGGLPQSPIKTVLPLVSLAVLLLAIALYLSRRQETVALELRANLADARLSALRGQLQPHFLFNVLNSIAMLARKGDTKAVVASVTGLGELLRVVLRDSPKGRIPLGEELSFIEKYLTLERFRFQDQLETTIDCPASLETAMVPAFILQPLVENALRHGVGKVDGRGVITIRAHRANSSLMVDVIDNGPGPGAATEGGIGLSNSRERLAGTYGTRARIELERNDGEGTVARVLLPLEYASDEPQR